MADTPLHLYALGLGSNQRHARYGRPAQILDAALQRLEAKGIRVVAHAPKCNSRPLGPSRRAYCNAAAVVETRLNPPKLLKKLQKVERHFGRKRQGLRWSSRTIDLDILLWSGGIWATPGLIIPHTEFRKRSFVLAPLARIAGDWRDPLSGFTIRQLKARLDRKRPAA